MNTRSSTASRRPGAALEVSLWTSTEAGEKPVSGRRAFEAVVVMPATREAVCRLRREVQRLLVEAGLADVADAVVLGAHELMANAVTHGCRRHPVKQFTLRLLHARGRVRVEVRDPSSTLPFQRTASSECEGGRGLLLVDALADHWGVQPEPGGGKTVWFELQLRGLPEDGRACVVGEVCRVAG
ncbi:MAG: ATP-binding protein, partial [Streptomyces sp.]|jgi:anti-sigma regulatory factor (Ser/Thr protein kinase)|nr:ATP-binding protein [Streptomyces sp.]